MKVMTWLAAIAMIWAGLPAAANCTGQNLIASMPQEARAGLHQAASEVPFHQGILWRATRGDAQIVLVGTYHFPDPRHQKTLDRLTTTLQNAAALYVEAGPEEDARLRQALSDDPTLISSAGGHNLSGRLNEREWQTVLTAMSERGFAPSDTDRLNPWFIAMMISISPCMFQQTGQDGLDQMLVEHAISADIPVYGLEPWDTALTLFDGLTPEQEEDLIRASLPAALYADDYAVTLTDAYFSGNVWEIWEFGRFDTYAKSGLSKQEVDSFYTLAQTRLIDRRNRNWIAPLIAGAEAAAKDGRGIVAGFGALHLPGTQGVLNLLKQEGWRVSRFD